MSPVPELAQDFAPYPPRPYPGAFDIPGGRGYPLRQPRVGWGPGLLEHWQRVWWHVRLLQHFRETLMRHYAYPRGENMVQEIEQDFEPYPQPWSGYLGPDTFIRPPRYPVSFELPTARLFEIGKAATPRPLPVPAVPLPPDNVEDPEPWCKPCGYPLIDCQCNRRQLARPAVLLGPPVPLPAACATCHEPRSAHCWLQFCADCDQLFCNDCLNNNGRCVNCAR